MTADNMRLRVIGETSDFREDLTNPGGLQVTLFESKYGYIQLTYNELEIGDGHFVMEWDSDQDAWVVHEGPHKGEKYSDVIITPLAHLPRAPAHLIEQARQTYGSDEIAVDDNALVSEADDGSWVQAWVWIEDEKE